MGTRGDGREREREREREERERGRDKEQNNFNQNSKNYKFCWNDRTILLERQYDTSWYSNINRKYVAKETILIER